MVDVLVKQKLSEAKRLKLAKTDWEIDRREFGFLNYKRFKDAWFVLADRHTKGMDEVEYVSPMSWMQELSTLLISPAPLYFSLMLSVYYPYFGV